MSGLKDRLLNFLAGGATVSVVAGLSTEMVAGAGRDLLVIGGLLLAVCFWLLPPQRSP